MRISEYTILRDALDAALEAGMNKTDKYSNTRLTEGQRNLLLQHVPNYFFCHLEEGGVELEEVEIEDDIDDRSKEGEWSHA